MESVGACVWVLAILKGAILKGKLASGLYLIQCGVMKRNLALMGLLLLMVTIASAADMTGTWAGSFKFNDQDVPIRVVLKGDSEITGTVEGLSGGTVQIKDGKLQGDNVTFWITINYQGNPVKLVYKGKVAGDEIKFEFGTEDGSWGTQFTAKKT